jgi:LysM domain
MIRSISPLALAFALALPGVALAQQQPGGGGVAPPAGGGGAPAPAPMPAPAPYYPGGVQPPPPGGVLGGGNVTGSSSRPIVGNETDKFDLMPKSGAGGTLRGDDSGPIFGGGRPLSVGGIGGVGEVNTDVHLVRKGDTLWRICDTYFRNPYQWPRIWSYNPQIQNPHWIYPGDQVRLKGDAVIATGPAAPAPTGNLTERRRQYPNDTVFLRDTGFIDDDDPINWGEITGAREDKMFLSNFDEVYLRVGPDHNVKIGDELTIFRPIRSLDNGKLVQIQGTVKVDQWNAKDRVARAQITESLDAIERGARLGPMLRRFDIVPPVRNEAEMRAEIIASVVPHPFYGQQQVVFINKGEPSGLKAGNRLFIVRRGDSWHKSMASPNAATRIALESESPAQTERVAPRDDAQYPEEVVGELRVLSVRKGSSTCYLTRATREIEVGDSVVARKGY